ncbi:uncharacterized protein L969DRAFT_87225 [Mixia osmundae IAM 14324]|uniref:ATP11-domain-containing protein n=1 Tax=Mixia osmundae (strain CBS 9802 / IAM 14324 / JCM 22182 / KY 12970) TaxID=764103 RepID=G7DZQ0_MIXOS|nr:uncharacterized protein L969DRAFT_87225 [Mixia osmundae IAM 14324]KEI39281.1 hypothetical protein L969DRAFT_87225 [Mixia osmundae IAM 14324]GAA96060.1 hypothetical protein E5Q_02721 [Mixia osmundae IAM 14324]
MLRAGSRTIARGSRSHQTVAKPSWIRTRTSTTSSDQPSNGAEIADEYLGGKQGIEHRRRVYADKYKDLLSRKAQERGISVEELKASARDELAKNRRVADMISRPTPSATRASPSGSKPKQFKVPQAKKSASPVRPLSDIIKLDKAFEETPKKISDLWNAYHMTKGKLSAVIPTEIYRAMAKEARQYSSFVVPLPRGPSAEASDRPPAAEMFFLQWAHLPPHTEAPAGQDAVPDVTTVLFTPLAEYQLHQTYAQPYLILTHYTDLAHSHGIVLMRGEITPDVANLTSADAQLLIWKLQQFYNTANMKADKGQAVIDERRQLLRTFHEKPSDFDLARLIELADQI